MTRRVRRVGVWEMARLVKRQGEEAMAERYRVRSWGVSRLCPQFGAALLAGLVALNAGAWPSRPEKELEKESVVRPPLVGPPSSTVLGDRDYGRLPLAFEANVGQTAEEVRFLARGGGYTLFLTGQEAVLTLRRARGKKSLHDVLRMSLAGASPAPRVVGEGELPGKSSYFIGNDPEKWRTNVPHFAKVRFEQVYPGIDLVYYGNERQLEHDFVVAAGADPSVIRLRFAGAKRLTVDAAGNLLLRTKGGEVALRAPATYQRVGEERRPVAGRYRVTAKHEAAFEVGAYDRRLALVIDPVLVYSTYLGGGAFDHAHAVAVDGWRCAHVIGHTASIDYPVQNPYQPTNRGSRDVFVTTLTPDGSSLVSSTYLGGSGDEQGLAIAVDQWGSAYLTGTTQSPDFPRVNPFQPTFGGAIDAFVAVLSPPGSQLLYSTFLGGSAPEEGADIAIGGDLVTAVGTTSSANFPTRNPIQFTRRGPSDAFITQFLIADMTVIHSTYHGGNADEMGLGVAMDTNGNAYVVGNTGSADFPLVDPYQGPRGGLDAFVTKIAPSQAIVYSTCLGGGGDDRGYEVAVDSAGRAAVTGWTSSTDFPVLNPVQGDQGGQDAYVTKLSEAGNSLVYSTYLGGSSTDYGWAIAVDDAGVAYVTGYTLSPNFPLVNPLDSSLGGSQDAFVTAVASEGGSLVYSTYLGGSGSDYGYGIAAESGAIVYVVGETASADFPLLNPILTDRPGSDGFVTKILESADLSLAKSDSQDPALAGTNLTYQLTVANNGPGTAGRVTVTDTLPLDVTYVSGSSGCNALGQTVICVADAVGAGATATFSITVNLRETAVPMITNTAGVVADQPDPVAGNNNDTETTTVLPAADLSVSIVDGPDPVALGGNVTYTVTVSNAGVSPATGVVLTEVLDASVNFVSASVGCSHAAGVVTCDLGDMAATDSRSPLITVATTVAGVIGNAASVTAVEADPNPGNNTANETTLVYETVAGNELRFFTATSRETENLLEWLNPGAPYVETIVRYNEAPTFALCTPPASPQDGTLLVVQAGPVGARDSYTHTGLDSSTTYCYAGFVHKGGGAVSLGREVKARPVPVGGPVVWGYSTGAVAMAPVAIGYGANAVSNDNVLHAMVRGETGGNWPASWTPFAMTGPAQHRPTSIPVPYGAATRQIILNSQDGHMYSLDAERGAPLGWALWQTADLGMLQAGTAGWLTAFGGDQDLLLVGTRMSGADNSLYAIDPATQAVVWSFGPPTESIGPIDAQAAVDYELGYVYFTSEERAPGAATVWCVDLRTHLRVWSRALGSMTAAPAYRNGRVYVGGDQGTSFPGWFYALDALDGSTIWTYPTSGLGPPKGYILADRLTGGLYFSTSNTVFALWDAGAGGNLSWSTTAIADPSAPLYATGQDLLYVGSSDGALWEIGTTSPFAERSVVLGDGEAAVGPPTRDNATSLIYVGTETGVIYAVRQPLP